MLVKPETTAAAPVTTACGNCGVDDRLLIHHVRHRGVFRRLCTTCVLRLHPQSFCPTCFQVYPPHPTNDAVLTCYKCYSSSHSHCVAAGPTSPPNPYICPLCVNPTDRIFKLRTAKEANVEVGEGLNAKSEEYRVMDRDAAKKLLAAAKIASTSMSKAAVAAKAEAERRAKEAAFARKRAREALEHVAYLVVKEKLRKKEAALSASIEVAGPGLSGSANVGYISGGFNGAKLKRENIVNVSNSNRSGVLAIGVGPSMVVEEKTNTTGNVERVDNSNHVPPAFNGVELREKEKIGVVTSQSALAVVEVNDDQALMDVDENSGNDVDLVILSEMETDAAKDLNTQGKGGDDAGDDIVLVQTVDDQMQSNSAEQHANPGPL